MADPRKVRYAPEVLYEAKVVNIPAGGVGITVDELSYFKPKTVTLTGIGGEREDDVYLRVTRDTDINVLDLNMGSSPDITNLMNAHLITKNLLRVVGYKSVLRNNYPVRYNYLVEEPNGVERVTKPIDVVTVAQNVTAVAPVVVDLGVPVEVLEDEKVILTKITCEQVATIYDNFIIVDRDFDPEYLRLNTFALSGLGRVNNADKIWVTCIDRLHIKLDVGTSITDRGFRYTYEVHPLSDEEKEAWGLG